MKMLGVQASAQAGCTDALRSCVFSWPGRVVSTR